VPKENIAGIKMIFADCSSGRSFEKKFAWVQLTHDILRDDDDNVIACLEDVNWKLTAMADEREGETFSDVVLAPVLMRRQ
jgi:hypothetical protein